MNHYSLFQLGDEALERGMLALFAEESRRCALEIAHIAEFDARRLYAREGYPSMFDYCVGKARLSDDAALKRIRAARAARKHPVLFHALADGRLHLTAIVLLAPRFTDDNVEKLIAAAAHRTVGEIGLLLAKHFPKPDVPLSLTAVAPVADMGKVVSKPPVASEPQLVSKPVEPAPRPKVAPLSPGRFEARFTMGQETHAAMRYLEELRGHRVTSEEMDRALALGFKAMVAGIEKRRFAATARPRAQRMPARGRHVPAEVKRAVLSRDGGRCTFVAEGGRRCEAYGRLEFDHIVPFARGGKSTAANLRLRCRAHNQYEADRAFGAGFMDSKRERAHGARDGQLRRDRRQAAVVECTDRAASQVQASAPSPRSRRDDDLDVIPWLRKLGFRNHEARRAAAHYDAMPDAPLEERVKAALAFLSPPVRVAEFECIQPAPDDPGPFDRLSPCAPSATRAGPAPS